MLKSLRYVALFILTALTTATAQVKDYCFSGGFLTNAGTLTALADGRWLATGNSAPYPGLIFNDTLFAVMFSSNGDVEQRFAVPSIANEVNFFKSATALPDGGFILIKEATLCDVANDVTTMLCYNAAAQLQWSISSLSSPTDFVPDYVVVAPDGNLIGMTYKKVVKINRQNGTVLWTSDINADNQFQLNNYTLAPGTEDLVVSGDPHVQYWKQITITGNPPAYVLANSYNFSGATYLTKIIAHPDNGLFYAHNAYYNNPGLVQFDLNGNYQITPLPNDSYVFDFKLAGTSMVVGVQEANACSIEVYGPATLVSTLNSPWVKGNAIAVQNDKIMMMGQHGSGPKSGYNPDGYFYFDTQDLWVRYSTIPGFSSTLQGANAGITDVQQISPVQIDTLNAGSSFEYYRIHGGEYKVKVTNASIYPIQSLDIMTAFNYAFFSICAERPAKRIHFSGPALQPGESRWIDFGNLGSAYQFEVPDTICFWSASPNDKPDYNHDNDVFCATLQTSATSEPGPAGFKCWPNPAGAVVHLSWTAPLVTDVPYRVFDLTGRVVANGLVSKGAVSQSISTALLPDGIYILKVGKYSSKVVIRQE